MFYINLALIIMFFVQSYLHRLISLLKGRSF